MTAQLLMDWVCVSRVNDIRSHLRRPKTIEDWLQVELADYLETLGCRVRPEDEISGTKETVDLIYTFFGKEYVVEIKVETQNRSGRFGKHSKYVATNSDFRKLSDYATCSGNEMNENYFLMMVAVHQRTIDRFRNQLLEDATRHYFQRAHNAGGQRDIAVFIFEAYNFV